MQENQDLTFLNPKQIDPEAPWQDSEASKVERREITPIKNNPADCDHYFEIIDITAREILCKKCPYGGAFRAGVDLDELRDGKPYLKGKEVSWRKR